MSRQQQCYQQLSARRKGFSGGFTLMELLVVMFILGLLSTVLISILAQSSALVSQGAAVIGLNQKARSAIEKMGPFIVSAVPDPTQAGPSGEAIVSPTTKLDAPTAADLATYTSVQFNTTEDFLDPDYDPSAPWDAAAAPRYVYEFAFDNTGGQVYQPDNGPPITLGRVVLRKVSGGGVANPEPRAMAHNVQLFRCYRMGANSVQVVVNTVGKRKGPAGNIIDVFEEQNAVLAVPAGNYL